MGNIILAMISEPYSEYHCSDYVVLGFDPFNLTFDCFAHICCLVARMMTVYSHF